MSDKYCPAGKINCSHSYVNDSNDKCCNPNYTELPVGIGVVVGPTEGFPADEVCRWPSKKEKILPKDKATLKSKFIALNNSQWWEFVKNCKTVYNWRCIICDDVINIETKPKRSIMGWRYCSNCDSLLTKRTGGGQSDPFNYYPVKVKNIQKRILK